MILNLVGRYNLEQEARAGSRLCPAHMFDLESMRSYSELAGPSNSLHGLQLRLEYGAASPPEHFGFASAVQQVAAAVVAAIQDERTAAAPLAVARDDFSAEGESPSAWPV
jgi:hypothetical protein